MRIWFIFIHLMVLLHWEVSLAQINWLEDCSEHKLCAELIIDVFERIMDEVGTEKTMDIELPRKTFKKDILGFRFEPETDPNAYLTYEVRKSDLSRTEIGVSLNNSGTFLVSYNFPFKLKK